MITLSLRRVVPRRCANPSEAAHRYRTRRRRRFTNRARRDLIKGRLQKDVRTKNTIILPGTPRERTVRRLEYYLSPHPFHS